MNRNVYIQTAIGILSALKGQLPAAVAVTSSSPHVDCLFHTQKLAEAFAALKEDAAVSESVFRNAAEAAEGVEALKNAHRITLIPLSAPSQDDFSLLTASAAQNALLVEKSGVSRTDEIGETLELLRGVGTTVFGFLYAE